MRAPSITPDQGGPIYFVLCDYGPEIGRAYRETDPVEADRERILTLLMGGEYSSPLQILAPCSERRSYVRLQSFNPPLVGNARRADSDSEREMIT